MRPMRQLSGSSPNELWQWQQQKTFSFEHFGQVSYVCSVSRRVDCSRSSCSPKSVRKSWQRLTAFSIWAANRTDIIIVFQYPVMGKVTAAGSARLSNGNRETECERWRGECTTKCFLISKLFVPFSSINCKDSRVSCASALPAMAFLHCLLSLTDWYNAPYSQRIRQSLRLSPRLGVGLTKCCNIILICTRNDCQLPPFYVDYTTSVAHCSSPFSLVAPFLRSSIAFQFSGRLSFRLQMKVLRALKVVF